MKSKAAREGAREEGLASLEELSERSTLGRSVLLL